jgi:hypothetical protein
VYVCLCATSQTHTNEIILQNCVKLYSNNNQFISYNIYLEIIRN